METVATLKTRDERRKTNDDKKIRQVQARHEKEVPPQNSWVGFAVKIDSLRNSSRCFRGLATGRFGIQNQTQYTSSSLFDARGSRRRAVQCPGSTSPRFVQRLHSPSYGTSWVLSPRSDPEARSGDAALYKKRQPVLRGQYGKLHPLLFAVNFSVVFCICYPVHKVRNHQTVSLPRLRAVRSQQYHLNQVDKDYQIHNFLGHASPEA